MVATVGDRPPDVPLLEDLRLALHEFRRRYNASWLVQKHQHRTPDQVRALLSQPVAHAA